MTYLVNLLPQERAALVDGREYRGPNALGNISRTLIGEGADPRAKLVAVRQGRPVLEGAIAAFAGRQWAGATTCPLFRRWRPHPRAQMHPLLVAWATENCLLRPGRYPPPGAALDGLDEGLAHKRDGGACGGRS